MDPLFLMVILVAAISFLLREGSMPLAALPHNQQNRGMNLCSSHGFKSLAEGQEVEFEIHTGEKGLHAANVTRVA